MSDFGSQTTSADSLSIVSEFLELLEEKVSSAEQMIAHEQAKAKKLYQLAAQNQLRDQSRKIL